MPNTRRYFHDRFVLLMLTINLFLACVSLVGILARLGEPGDTYVHQFRANLGLNAYDAGGAGEIVSFAVFAVFIFAAQLILSLRLYPIRKAASWMIMTLAMLLLVLTLIVSNALLALT
jgi:hypothetical protein